MSTTIPETTPLTLEQKAFLLAGASTWTTVGIDGAVPSLFLSDGPHGIRKQGMNGDHLGIGNSLPAVCFPPSVGIGSTWNRDVARLVGEHLGAEARRLEVNVLLGPGLNIKRSPLGGRNFEYLSEDPRLSGELAAAVVSGIQSQGVAATPKHFVVNNQETDRMRVSATVSQRALREIYFPAFERVVREAHPWALMSSYNRVNGTFADESHELLTEILRDEWGFDGLVMSDWGAVTDKVAVAKAGLDLEMPFSGRTQILVDAVNSGELDESVLDTAIARLQQLAARTTENLPSVDIDIDASQRVALTAARESIVLLKNDGILPLQSAGLGSVLVVGEFARTPRFQGGGSSRVVPTRLVSALDALTELAEEGTNISFAPGYTLDRSTDQALADAAVQAAAGADVVLAFLGLPDYAESEGFDRETLSLPDDQLALLHRLADTGVRVVVSLSNGAIVEVSSWQDSVSAVVETWLLGQEGGRATAEVLFGLTNPSGRLTETIPHRLEDTPSYLTFPGSDGEVLYGEDLFVGYRSYDTRGTDVAYPFGFGLSYTSFTFGEVAMTQTGKNEWTATVTVTNTGERAGAEVVQLYVAATDSKITRASHELRGFSKVFLQPGESTEVTLPIIERDLAHWNTREKRWQVEPGTYRVEIGASSRDIRTTAELVSEGDGIIDPLRGDSTLGEWASHPAAAEVVAAIRAKMPASIFEQAPELLAMAQAMPVVKLTEMGSFLPIEVVHDVVQRSGGSM